MSQNPSGITYTANLRTKILDFRVFDSNIILSLRGGILMPIAISPESFESTSFSRDNLSREIVHRASGNYYRYRCGSIQLRALCVA